MNDHLLEQGSPWLCGETMTIADYLASGIFSLGEVIGCTFSAYPNVASWYERIKALPNWQSPMQGSTNGQNSCRAPNNWRYNPATRKERRVCGHKPHMTVPAFLLSLKFTLHYIPVPG